MRRSVTSAASVSASVARRFKVSTGIYQSTKFSVSAMPALSVNIFARARQSHHKYLFQGNKVKKMDLMITGVGGQGVVLASDIIGESALSAGYDVKKTDTIGMAQRGGSVISPFRIPPEVRSPL